MALTPPPPPLLYGAMNPIYGLFMGGSKLCDDYALETNAPYKLTNQLRNSKKYG